MALLADAFSEFQTKYFADLNQLRWLQLHSSKLKTLNEDSFNGLLNLKYLDLVPGFMIAENKLVAKITSLKRIYLN